MPTDVAPVIRLANEIAAQFHHQPVPTAAAAVAGHIRQFWDPRMRAALLALAPSAGAGLDERAIAAVAVLREGAD